MLRLQHYRQTFVYSQKLGIVYTVGLNEDPNIQPLDSCICILIIYTGVARLFVKGSMRIPSILFLSVPVFTQKAREPNQASKPDCHGP